LFDSDFGIVFFSFQFQFDVEAKDGGIFEGLWLLFETRV
jgi:hypothetical protein